MTSGTNWDVLDKGFKAQFRDVLDTRFALRCTIVFVQCRYGCAHNGGFRQ